MFVCCFELATFFRLRYLSFPKLDFFVLPISYYRHRFLLAVKNVIKYICDLIDDIFPSLFCIETILSPLTGDSM